MCIREGRELQPTEMLDLVDRLFACSQPQLTPNGKPIVANMPMDEIDKKFKS
jgi:DNA mismatch repair protein MutL